MLVQLILEFIENLKKEHEKQKIPVDKKILELLSELSKYFSFKSANSTLDKNDINYLLQCYKTRWKAIYDDEENDYTLCPSTINQLWIDLAKKLGDETGLLYLKILMPTITNSVDPHDGSKLTETETLTNFYIAYDGVTLCRKRSLCDYLLAHNGELSTRNSSKKISVFTLDELSRLKRCTQAKGAFSIENSSSGEQQFTSFYDFICKRPLANLTKRGKMPEGLLPHLLELIEYYYVLKSKSESFAAFKNGTRDFFKRLYGYPLVNVNFFYGQKIFSHEREHCLVDVFLTVFAATKFDLEHEMEILAEFLINFHPALKARSKELAPIYEKKCFARIDQQQIEAYECCRSLLVSFYVTQFSIGNVSNIVSGLATIAEWDIENSVPKELLATYTELQLVFASARPTDFVKAYANIINNYITPRIDDTAFWTWCSRDGSTNKWLTQVKNSSLAAIGGFWFEPERILSALLIFHTHSSHVKTRINNFLDNLIKTYSQTQDDFKKQLRVNILFSRFLSKLNEEQRRNLMLVLAVCDLKTAKEQFISNCALHINKQLEYKGYSQHTESSPQFFSSAIKADVEINLSEKIESVIGLIDNYTNRLSLQHLKQNVQKEIRHYLFILKDPILTVAEREQANESTHTNPDPLGAYT